MLRQLENRALQVDRHPFRVPNGRRAADLVARMALRDLGLAGLDALPARLAREVLGRHLPVAVHQHDERLARPRPASPASSRPRARARRAHCADTSVPPCSTYSYSCSVIGDLVAFRNTVAGVSATGMMLRVQRLQPLARDVRVDLRGRDVRVAEQHLHHAQVGAVVDEMRGEGVAQDVRRELLAGDRRARRSA